MSIFGYEIYDLFYRNYDCSINELGKNFMKLEVSDGLAAQVSKIDRNLIMHLY